MTFLSLDLEYGWNKNQAAYLQWSNENWWFQFGMAVDYFSFLLIIIEHTVAGSTGTILSVEMDGCNSVPCVVHHGTHATGRVTVQSNSQTTALSCEVRNSKIMSMPQTGSPCRLAVIAVDRINSTPQTGLIFNYFLIIVWYVIHQLISTDRINVQHNN